MQPSIEVGDVVVARPIAASTELLGRVITAKNPAKPTSLLTHRIVEDKHDGTYVTKGDANRDPDSTPMPRENIKGRGLLLVPWIGLPAHWASVGDIAPLVITVAGLGTLVVFARDPYTRHTADRQPARRPTRSLRAASAVGLSVALLAGGASVMPAALARSSASFTATTQNAGNNWRLSCLTSAPFTFESDDTCWAGLGDLAGKADSTTAWANPAGGTSFGTTTAVPLTGNNYNMFLARTGDVNLSSKTMITAYVSARSGVGTNWGGNGMQAKIYIETGANNQFYSPTTGNAGLTANVQSNPSGTYLTFDISGLPSRSWTRRIGVQFVPSVGSGGTAYLNVDNVTIT
jgi:signal peptidase I